MTKNFPGFQIVVPFLKKDSDYNKNLIARLENKIPTWNNFLGTLITSYCSDIENLSRNINEGFDKCPEHISSVILTIIAHGGGNDESFYLAPDEENNDLILDYRTLFEIIPNHDKMLFIDLMSVCESNKIQNHQEKLSIFSFEEIWLTSEKVGSVLNSFQVVEFENYEAFFEYTDDINLLKIDG